METDHSSLWSKPSFQSSLFYAGIFLVAIIGGSLVLASTRWGAFLSDDSYYYIKPARDALAGNGFSPSPIFAPLLPAVLTVMGHLGLAPLEGVRFLNAVLFSANIVLAGLIVRKMGAAPVFALMAGLMTALSENGIEAHSWAMSEAIAITFSLLALYLVLLYFDKQKGLWLLVGGLAAALASLSRFAALPVVGAISIGLLFGDRARPIWRRIQIAAVFGLLCLAPFGFYVMRTNQILGRPLYYTSYVTTSFTRENLIWYLYNSLNWFIPGRLLRDREIIAGVIFAILLVGVILAFWYLRERNPSSKVRILTPAVVLLLLFVLLNYLMLYIARGLTLLAIYNPRYLVPPLTVVWILAIYFLDRLWRLGKWSTRPIVVAVCLVFLAYYGYRAVDFTRAMYDWGLGYANLGWHKSETIPYLNENPDLNVVATGDIGIFFWTERLPRVITSFANPQAMRDHLCATQGELVIMKSMPPEIYNMDRAALIEGLALKVDLNDSEIYQCKK